MHKQYIIFFILLLPLKIYSQAITENFDVIPDSLFVPDTVRITTETYPLATTETLITPDTVVAPVDGYTTDTIAVKEAFKPDPMKSVWWGAIIPGYGQIVNRKYWKLPIVYGGFMGCAYAMTFFSERYQSYKIGYRDMIDTDPGTKSYLDHIPPGYTLESIGEENLKNYLKSGQDNYRRYRDLSVLISIIYYGLTVLEAYVDAQLYDFDISPDLSMRLQPAFINNDVVHINTPTPGMLNGIGYNNAVGIQCTFQLK